MSNSLKIKVLTVSLILLMIITLGTICLAAEEQPMEETQEVEVKLNRKIYFEGQTYWADNGRRVRKEYNDGELGCGIISIIKKNKEFGIYVTGEGWISKEQIVSSQKFIDIQIDKDNLKEDGLGVTITVDGEYLDVKSDNEGIIEYKDGKLEAKANGNTTVTFTTEEGQEVEVLAKVLEGEVVLSIPEKQISAEMTGDIEIVDKIKIEAEGDAKAALVIKEDGFDITAEGEADVVVKAEDKEIVKVEQTLDGKVEVNPEGVTGEANGEGKIIIKVDENEIAKMEHTVDADITVNPEGVTAEANANQTLNILERFALKFKENANLKADAEKVTVGAGGDMLLQQDEQEQELFDGEANLTYKYGEEDATADVVVEVLEQEVINKKEIKVVETMRRLLEKMKAQ